MLVGFAGSVGDLDAAVKAGADFALVDSNAARDVKELRSKVGDLPLLVSSKLGGREAANSLHEAGVDAALVSDDTPASALLIEELGYVLTLPAAAEEIYLRSLDSLNLEAVLLQTLPAPLTVAAQIELNRIAGLARKPLLCQLDSVLDKDDLQALRSAGAVGLLTGTANIAALKEAVAALPPRRQRRDDRPVVSLPRGQAPAEHDDDDDDE